jgi:hypothetical protein
MLSISLSSVHAGPRDFLTRINNAFKNSWTAKNIRHYREFITYQRNPYNSREYSIDRMKREYGSVPCDNFTKSADEALQNAGVTRPVISLLGSKEVYLGRAIADPYYPQEYIIVNASLNKHQQLGTLCHEVGHIAHGDILPKAEYRNMKFFGGYLAASAAIATAATTVCHYLTGMPLVDMVVGLVCARGSLKTGELIDLARSRYREKRADACGYNLLLKMNKIDTVFSEIYDYLKSHALYPETKLKTMGSEHPSDIDRAKAALSILQEHGIDIRDESFFPHEWSEGDKKYYLEQLDTMPEFKKNIERIDKV